MPPENNVVPVKIGKFKASKTIVMESWAVLKQDKNIMWFPVVSAISTVLAVIILGYLFFLVILGGHTAGFDPKNTEQFGNVVSYVMLFIFYLIVMFIVNFFEAGLFTVVQGRFSGQSLSFKDGINNAKKYIGKIFIWSLISATVGVILQLIANKSRIIGQIVAMVLGATWNILTFFSLPVLIIGNLSVKDSFKESASMIRKTWGETFIVKFGVGLFFSLIIFVLIALSVGLVIIFQSAIAAIVILAVLIAAVIILSIISTTLNSIFKLVLFNYARTGQVPQGFSAEVIGGAVKKTV